MVYCSKCGKQNEDDVELCVVCEVLRSTRREAGGHGMLEKNEGQTNVLDCLEVAQSLDYSSA